MLLPLLYLILALLMLCMPGAWLYRSRSKHLPLPQMMDDWRLRYGAIHWMAIVDLVRAIAGVWFLRQSFFVQGDLPVDHPWARDYRSLVILAGLVAQLQFHRLKEGEVFAPIAFLSGVILMRAPLGVALPALVLGFASMLAARRIAMWFWVTAPALVVLGVLLKLSLIATGTLGLLAGLPLALIVGNNRQFVLPVRLSVYNRINQTAQSFSSRLRV